MLGFKNSNNEYQLQANTVEHLKKTQCLDILRSLTTLHLHYVPRLIKILAVDHSIRYVCVC